MDHPGTMADDDTVKTMTSRNRLERRTAMTTARQRTVTIGAGLIVLAGVLYGCRDFLTAPPQGTLDELSLANAAGVEATLIGAYAMLGGWIPGIGAWGATASNWPHGSVPSDDAYKGSDPADQAPITDLELYNWGTGGAESYLNDKWRAVYEGVVRSNATLRLLNRVLAENPDELSAADADGIRGEALFLRAHYHFEAWRMWENVPYYTEADTDFRKPNDAEVIPLILADLDEAIGLLPDTPRRGHVARATAWTARAYKGRVQVQSGDYAGGLATLRQFETGGPYDLQPNFHQVWTGFAQYANGPETILAYQASANDGEPDGNNANWGETLNFPHGGDMFGCCGFHQPSQNLVNFFVVDGDGLPVALSDPAGWNARDANVDASFTGPVDPRLDWTVGRDGVPYKDWGLHAPGWIRDRGYGGPYSPKKNVHESASGAASNVGWNARHLNNVNIHLYRYADLLLLLAEAEVEAGSLENARAIVNRIRARAGAAAQGPGDDAATIAVAIDDPSITWANYSIGEYTTPWTDQATARNAVRYERRLELAMEGHRLFDLRRWGIAPQVLNDYVAVEAGRRAYLGAAAGVMARHNRYPIPNVQIELSKVEGEERLMQNPDW
jgi:starch-binding outer membrane protein, SusD/RagB family